MIHHEKHPYHTKTFVEYLLLPKKQTPHLYLDMDKETMICHAT
jgi:hypothetical protein